MRNKLLLPILLTTILLPTKAALLSKISIHEKTIYCFVEAILNLNYQEALVGMQPLVLDTEQHAIESLRKIFRYSSTKYNTIERLRYYNFLTDKLKAYFTYNQEHGIEIDSEEGEVDTLQFLQITAHNAFQGIVLGHGDMTLEDASYVLKSRMDTLIIRSLLGSATLPSTESEIKSFADSELAKYGYDPNKIDNYPTVLETLKQQIADYEKQ